MKQHTVLVPIDGSPFSRQIIPHLCNLFDPENYALILFRVAEAPTGILSAPPRIVSMAWPASMYETATDVEYARHPIYATQLEDGARPLVEKVLREEQQRLEQAGYTVSVVVRFGDPAAEIIDFARQERVGMVAMATHSRAGLSYLALGSVANQVLRNLSIPVLLVRPSEDEPPSWLIQPTS